MMLHDVVAVQECDATGADGISAAWYKKRNHPACAEGGFPNAMSQGVLSHYTLLRPPIRLNKKSTMKMKKMIFAIVAAPAAIPVNPNIAATIAIIKKVTVQRNILLFL